MCVSIDGVELRFLKNAVDNVMPFSSAQEVQLSVSISNSSCYCKIMEDLYKNLRWKKSKVFVPFPNIFYFCNLSVNIYRNYQVISSLS